MTVSFKKKYQSLLDTNVTQAQVIAAQKLRINELATKAAALEGIIQAKQPEQFNTSKQLEYQNSVNSKLQLQVDLLYKLVKFQSAMIADRVDQHDYS